MKKYILIAITLFLTLSGHSQSVDQQALSYSVRYEKSHLFLQKDSGFNVVDYDIEWPEVVDFDKVTALKHALSKSITGLVTSDIDSTLSNFNYLYGTPVTGQFKTIPDDRRFCYITATARIVGYKKGHWIAYYIENKVEPQKLSEFKAHNEARVIVYDISRDKLILANGLISQAVTTQVLPQDFYDYLFSPLSDDLFNNMRACQVDGVWVQDDNLCFLITATTLETQVRFTSSMPLAEYSYALSREGRRVFTKDVKAKYPETIPTKTTWHGDSIYNNVEKMPQFHNGNEGLKQYLSHITPPDKQVGHNVKVLTSYIVDKDGNIQDVQVVSPVDPVIDRHAASIVKGMPAYTPGEQNGKKVCVRLYLPITYR